MTELLAFSTFSITFSLIPVSPTCLSSYLSFSQTFPSLLRPQRIDSPNCELPVSVTRFQDSLLCNPSQFESASGNSSQVTPELLQVLEYRGR